MATLYWTTSTNDDYRKKEFKKKEKKRKKIVDTPGDKMKEEKNVRKRKKQIISLPDNKYLTAQKILYMITKTVYSGSRGNGGAFTEQNEKKFLHLR